jgi:hypothetical protein
MAIHNGHPEKYIGLKNQISEKSLLDEGHIEALKVNFAWLPID